MEERLKTEDQERKDRSDRLIESLRQKHKSILDQKDDDLTDLKLKLSDAHDSSEKLRLDRDSLRTQLDKLHDQLRVLKDDNSIKYETYHR